MQGTRHAPRSLWLALSVLLAAAVGAGAAQAQSTPHHTTPLQTVPAIDVPRYMGTWHEIAKYPNWFQKKCVSSTSATYSLQADGQVQVLNRCKTASGEWSDALGAARQIGAKDSPRLQVRFAPAWLSFIPMVWGDYWVIDIDPDYQWVVVSEPRREYLWILARTPQLPAATLNTLQTRLMAKGFDVQRLEMSAP